MVATASYNNQWSTPQQVSSTVRYPVEGIASIVTHVGIIVDQVILYLEAKKNSTFQTFHSFLL